MKRILPLTFPMLHIFFVILIVSCLPKQDSLAIDLNGVLGYDWNITIDEIQKDFVEKQYSEIKIENDSIYAKADYNGLFSDCYFRFSNGNMYAGGILYLGTPDPDVSEDGYTLDNLYTIQKNILQLFRAQYGEPQEVEEDEEEFVGEIRYYRWDFDNNCTLEFSMQIEYFILTACWIQVQYTNKNIEVIKVEEKPSIFSEGDYTYKKNENGTITITKYAGSGDVIIPAEIAGKSVTAIGNDAFKGYYGKKLTSVIIPDSVTSIGVHAFSSNRLTSIIVPDSVTSIAAYAFGYNQLTNATIPDHITEIDLAVFSDNKLTSFIIPKGVTEIGQCAFMGNQLASIIIPDGVTYIGLAAFMGNRLTSVIIPNGVTGIGSQAFEGNQLANVTIGNHVKTIGHYAFRENKLTSINIPDSVRTIDYHAFSDNPLTSIKIGANVIITDRDDGAFKGSGIPNGFDDFYVSNKRKAGTYVFMNGRWIFSN